MPNVLAEWFQSHGGTASKRELAARLGVRWATLHDIAEHGAIPRAALAMRIEAATGGAVRAAVLIGLEPPPRKRGRKQAVSR